MTKWYNPITTTNDAEVKGVPRMTKEELLAEEYICNGKCQDDITKNYVHCKSCTRIKDFLVGLKAGRPQWHNVTDWKDNSQFPKEELKTYLVCLYQDHYVICELDITEGYRQFYLPDNLEFIDPQDVIAWCEIPTFDKE